MKRTTNYNLAIPELVDAADITPISENFETIDEKIFLAEKATKTFDYLSDTYGFSFEKVDQNTYLETLSSTSPINGTRRTVHSTKSGNNVYTTTITLNGEVTTKTLTMVGNNAEMVVE